MNVKNKTKKKKVLPHNVNFSAVQWYHTSSRTKSIMNNDSTSINQRTQRAFKMKIGDWSEKIINSYTAKPVCWNGWIS